mmetsp:Transcript_14902/g.32853  ORF Transcript_14902/g.32853 Transcript_14902/m.32853 type:complete len:510 (+) Transcript_14902:276-1805(+)|eukprot:CAMPEP_0206496998 /NCGR_PEP_ID=MMETSP0324_2-20121206/49860_1 /ASSEMBLY_ACC=CAM_ASM_000836 /TAXON_ID=2866 /ORGANISM="Crypthecodinium cohnii, Strain Seligo" /LENGTH=509 /DNA_ID=CAMNT_0053982357 /DNA_START=196 /DNA_END=1725 /DNA_ORIENTATION=+
MENLTASAVIKDKLGHVASDFLHKLDHTVSNLGKNKPTEGQPMNYKVTHKGGALVRAGYETTSAQVHQLAAGEVVTMVELVGRRARIISPVEGWVSTETKDGVQIMRPCTMQRKSVQNEAFEQMFEQKFNRLKNQGKSGGTSSSGVDPRTQRYERTPSPEPDRRRRDRDRNRDRDSSEEDRRRRDDRDDRRSAPAPTPAPTRDVGASSGGFIPKMAAPGSKGPMFSGAPPPSNGGSGGGGGGGMSSLLGDDDDFFGGGGGAQATSAAPAAAAVAPPAKASDGFDLLGFGESSAPSTAAASGNNDFFGFDAPAPAPTSAPAAGGFPAFAPPPAASSSAFPTSFPPPPAAAAAPARGNDDWAGFQNSGGFGVSPAANPGMTQQDKFAAAFGSGQASSMPQATGMQAMGWGGGGMQQQQQQQMTSPFGGPAQGGYPTGGAAQSPAANPFGSPAAAGGGAPWGMPATAGGGGNANDLMSKAMQGMSNLSLKPPPAQSSTSSNNAMNFDLLNFG